MARKAVWVFSEGTWHEVGNPVGGIDFNKMNDFDIFGANSDYLNIQIFGGGTLIDSKLVYKLLVYDHGAVHVHDGDGWLGFQNNGDGMYSGMSGNTDYGEEIIGRRRTVDTSGAQVDGLIFTNNGDGRISFSNTGGQTVSENYAGGHVFYSPGSDSNEVGFKFILAGSEFFIMQDETIVRDGTHHLVSQTQVQPVMRMYVDTKNQVWLFNLPTSSPGGTDQLWKDGSGFLRIT